MASKLENLRNLKAEAWAKLQSENHDINRAAIMMAHQDIKAADDVGVAIFRMLSYGGKAAITAISDCILLTGIDLAIREEERKILR